MNAGTTGEPSRRGDLASDSGSERLITISARVAQHGLIAAECKYLTGGVPDAAGVASATSIELVTRGAYVQQGLTVIAAGETFDDLVNAVRDASFDANRFRINVHDPLDRADRGATEMAIDLADVIEFGPDLSDPLHRFLVALHEGEWVFGEVRSVTDASYRRHDGKPWTTSSSLDSRFARGLVNLVPQATSVLDPCCGAGSIVLEAAALGLDARAVDWKPAMVGMTNQNLDHFDAVAEVVRADSKTHEFAPVDAVVTDLPYGHAIDADETTIRAIIANCARTAPLGVFVAPADFTMWLRSAGYVDVEVYTVLKRRGFTRWIHRARSALVA